MPDRRTPLPPRAARLRARPLGAVIGLALPCLLGLATVAQAQEPPRSWRIDAEIKVGATATTNSGVSDSQQLGSDLIVDVAPKVTVKHEGGRAKVDGDLQLNTLGYAGGTQPNRVLPKGQLRFSIEALERWFYVEAQAVIDQTNSNPFAARGDGDSALNKVNSLQYRLSPYLQRSFTPTLSMLARIDLEWTRRSGEYSISDPRRDQRSRRALYRLEQLPRPFGGSVEFNASETRFITDVEPVLRLSEGRAVASYQFDPSLTLGLVLGRGRTEYLQASQGDTFGGARLQWAPSQRTSLKASAERRFFGTAYNTEFSHRSPFVGIYLNLLAEPSGQPTSFLLNPGGDVAGLLDAIFTTRFPNPAERAAVVQGVLNGLGQPSSLTRPAEVFSDYAQLQRRGNLAIVLQGRRSTVSLRLQTLSASQLNRADSPFVPAPGFGADNRQRLVSLDINRRLQNDLRVDFSITSGRIEGLGALAGSLTTEQIARLTLTWEINPDLSATAGLRRQVVNSTVTLSAQEWALIAGLLHRF
jgi:uncharacterized protein (PEP-CTERM system associated)